MVIVVAEPMLNHAWAEEEAGGLVVVPGREGVEKVAEQAL